MGRAAVRVAMWSGPRNISTALMRSWGNREDTVVVDEPFYAHYLASTDIDHPGCDEVIATHDSDWRSVVAALTAPLPAGKTIGYQKHMAHHLLPDIDTAWLDDVTSAFLLRDPAEMLVSLAKVLPHPRLEDTGLPQQLAIYERVAVRENEPPAVLNARDVLKRPEPMLRALCGHLGVAFDPKMLSWPAGPRTTDGVWARWWYDAVIASTGFQPYRPASGGVPDELRPLLRSCLEYYEQLDRVRIVA